MTRKSVVTPVNRHRCDYRAFYIDWDSSTSVQLVLKCLRSFDSCPIVPADKSW